MVNGELLTVDDLLAPFATARTEAAPRGRMLPRLPDHPANAKYWWHDPHYLEESKRSCCAGTCPGLRRVRWRLAVSGLWRPTRTWLHLTRGGAAFRRSNDMESLPYTAFSIPERTRGHLQRQFFGFWL